MTRNIYRKDHSNEDRELEDLEEAKELDVEPAESPEEKSFKKRYGDLRSYSQKQLAEKEQELKKLKEQLEAAQRDDKKMPVNMEEFQNWLNTYPRVAGFVDTMVKQGVEQLGKRLDEIESRNKQDSERNANEKAKIELMKLHPDFYESKDGRPPIVEQQEFHDWVEEQEHQGINQAHQALYENTTNARLAAKWITLFKTETGYYNNKKPKKDNSREEGARSVRFNGSATPSESSNKYDFSESQVARMTEREYNKYERDIDEAIRSGRFLYDLSGGAR